MRAFSASEAQAAIAASSSARPANGLERSKPDLR
jgi:hypothetical protein